MSDFQLDTSIQEQVNSMLMSSTDPSAQEHAMAILQEVSQNPDFPIYLLYSIGNAEIGIPAQTTAANLLRHAIKKIPIALRKPIKQLSTQILQPCFAIQDISFVNSVSALVAELVHEFGISIFPDMNSTVSGLFADETTYLSGLSLVFELALQNTVISGEYIAAIPDFVFSEDFGIASAAAQCVEELSKHMKEAIKDSCVLPILTNESVTELDESILVKIIVAVGNLLETDEEEEIADEEVECMLTFIKVCMASDSDSLSVPAMAVYQEHPMEFDQEVCEVLYTKLAQDEIMELGEVSQQCKYLLSDILQNDPDSTSSFLFQLVQEHIESAELSEFRSAIRTLSLVSPSLEDISEVVPAVLAKLAQGVDPQIKIESALCLVEMSVAHQDIGASVLASLLPLINDGDENVRKAVLESLTDLYEVIEFSANDALPHYIAAFPRISTQEGNIILDSLACCLEQAGDLAESDKLQTVLEGIIPFAIEVPDSNPAFVSALTVLEKSISSVAAVLQPVFENEPLISKCIALLSNEEGELPEIQFESEAQDVELAGSMYDTTAAKIVNFMSASLKAEAELGVDTFNEVFMTVGHFAEAAIQRKYAHLLTKIASWEYLSSALKLLPFDEFVEGVINAAVEETGIDNDDDLLGNIAFLFYSLFQNITPEGKVVKAILLNMCNGIKNAKDDLDMKNMACCIMVCLSLLQAPNVAAVPDNPEGTDDVLQYVISLMLMQEDTPEEIQGLCQQFKIEE